MARDQSPGTMQAILPSQRRIAAATGQPKDLGALARALMKVDAREAERLLRDVVDTAVETGDYRIASVTAGDLVSLLRDAGRLAEALAVLGEASDYTGRAGLGPWTRLANHGCRLQLLALLGDHEKVLSEAEELLTDMAALPDWPDASETVHPWNVREMILTVGHLSATRTGKWTRCLELSAEIVLSNRQRGAGIHEATGFRFNDAGPLIRLGRLEEARRLLAECQQVFEDYADARMLARVLSARAVLESETGQQRTATELELTALRWRYARPEPFDIAAGHGNMATYLRRLGEGLDGQRAHRLASVLIFGLVGMAEYFGDAVQALVMELREDEGTGMSLPSTIEQVVAVAEQAEGVRLAAVLTALHPDLAAIEAALAEILSAARAAAPAPASAPADPPQD
jgi:tetratricopeptide (TPR) repeat protein